MGNNAVGFLVLAAQRLVRIQRWGRGDSNPHASRHMLLRHARLPIPPLPLVETLFPLPAQAITVNLAFPCLERPGINLE
jgi:hypothetical protein